MKLKYYSNIFVKKNRNKTLLDRQIEDIDTGDVSEIFVFFALARSENKKKNEFSQKKGTHSLIA